MLDGLVSRLHAPFVRHSCAIRALVTSVLRLLGFGARSKRTAIALR
jgi:hypothetical protein